MKQKMNSYCCKPDAAFPEHWLWRVFDLPDETDAAAVTGPVGDELVLDGVRISGQPLSFPPSGQTVLKEYFRRTGQLILLVCDFTEEAAGSCVIGVSADWNLILKLNGEEVCSTWRVGSGEHTIEPDDHIAEIHYRAGKNQLTMLIRFGLTARVAASLMKNEHPKLRYAPWCTFPDSETGAFTVIFSTFHPCPAGLDYRKKGSAEWLRVYDNQGGQIRRDQAIHHIRLTDLEPDTEYEYRAVLLDELKRWEEIPDPEIYSVRTLPADSREFRFNFTADLQAPAKVPALAEQMSRIPADFSVFAGDPVWTSDFDPAYLENAYLPLAKKFADRPLVAVRGNHEMYGKDTSRFFEYFTPPPELGVEGYYAFRCGDAFFFALDFCDDDGRCPWPSTRALHDIDPYLEREARWLKNVIRQPACRDARWRIVLAHGVPAGDFKSYLPDHIRKVIEPVFGGSSPECRIHLWLGGHIHYAVRSIPGKNQLRTTVDPELRYAGNERGADISCWHFPVCAVSGPSRLNPPSLVNSFFSVAVKPDRIEVDSYDIEGKRYDRFAVSSSGEILEEQPSESFRLYTLS